MYPGSAVEPRIAVNPRDPANLLVAWQQDRWSGGGASGIVSAVSTDGGATWETTPAPFSRCTAAAIPHDRASDPWVAFTSTGVAIQAALGVNTDGSTSVVASRSTDGGRSWTTAVEVSAGLARGFNDKESVTADLARRVLYLVWDRTRNSEEADEAKAATGATGTPTPAATTAAAATASAPTPTAAANSQQILLSTSTDDGRTWDRPRVIGGTIGTPLGNQIAVLPDGTLVNVFELVTESGQIEESMRSTDAGRTWTTPTRIATRRAPSLPLPGPDVGIRSGSGIPDVAVDPRTGRVVVVWEDGRFRSGPGVDLALASSADGGLTWSEPKQVNAPGAVEWALTPALTVDPAGTVAVSYTVLHVPTAAGPLLVDRVLRTSLDLRTWRETRLTPTSFDLRLAPQSGGYFLGDYAGLTTSSKGFASAFPVVAPGAPQGTSVLVVTPVEGAAPTP